MNYSQEWQNKLDQYNRLRQGKTWEEIAIQRRLFDPDNSESKTLIILDKPVWVEIQYLSDRSHPLRKIKAISKYNVYFDGTYPTYNITATALGCIYGWEYIIDNHSLDLNTVPTDDCQELLINFLKEYTDAFNPPIPKGILKIPTSL